MSDKKRSKRRKDEYTGPGGAETEVEKPSKDEFAIAKWIKKNVPTKKTKFLNHNVEYFTASKALDALMASKYAQGEQSLLPTREIAIEFLDTMLAHKFFHRAKKVPVSEAELRKGKKKDGDKEKSDDDRKDVKKRNVAKDDKAGTDDPENSHAEGKSEKSVEKEKKKRKIRLDMHPDQVFVDGPEAYVWIYDPIPVHYWLIGTLLVVGAIVICLFPLWPPSIRKGVYYLSIAAAGFLVFILGLAVLRFIVFCVVWTATGSKHHFWLFPNLTEDVGFLESFWPLYTHDYRDGNTSKKDKKDKKRKKEKDSDGEDDANVTLLGPEKIENIKENETGTLVTPSSSEVVDNTKSESVKTISDVKDDKTSEDTLQRKNSSDPSDRDSDSESSHRSTDKDFEIVNSEDVDTS